MEDVQKFGPNIVRFHLATGERRLDILRCYIDPKNTSTIESVVAALKERPQGAKLLVAGDLNAKLSDLEGYRRVEEIAAALTTVGMEDMSENLLPHRRTWYQDGRTWSIVRAGREVRSRTNYILGTDHRLFWNVSVRDPRHN